MGNLENKWLSYFSDPSRFVDLVNGWLTQGQEEFHVSDAEPEDRRFDQVGTKARRKAEKLASRYRDLCMRLSGCRYRLIVGTELSSYRDYQAPLRVMDYDALEYQRQVRRLEGQHRQAKDLGGDEKLSGLSRADRLIPVVSLYLYTGSEEWDAPTHLHDMLEWGALPGFVRQYVGDYSVHLLDIAHTPDERLREFPDELAGIFLFIKYQGNSRKLQEIAESMPVFRHMSREGYELVAVHTNAQELLEKEKEEEEEQDMCQAIKEMIADGEARGEVRGEIYGKADLVLSLLDDLGKVSDELRKHIFQVQDPQKLNQYGKIAARAESVEQFMVKIESI